MPPEQNERCQTTTPGTLCLDRTSASFRDLPLLYDIIGDHFQMNGFQQRLVLYSRRCLNFLRLSPNVVFEELVLSSRIASPLINETIFNVGRMAWVEMCVSKGFSSKHKNLSTNWKRKKQKEFSLTACGKLWYFLGGCWTGFFQDSMLVYTKRTSNWKH